MANDYVKLRAGFDCIFTMRIIGDGINICIEYENEEGEQESKSCAFFKDAYKFFDAVDDLRPDCDDIFIKLKPISVKRYKLMPVKGDE